MKKNKWLKGLITTVVVIIGICAVGWFTWNLGQIFLDLVIESPIENKVQAEVTTSEILVLPQFDFWTCQIGVFNDKMNAEGMIALTLAKGWKAEIIQENPYTVAVGLFSSKEKAVTQSTALAQNSIEPWVRKETFPELHYKVNGRSVGIVSSTLRFSNSLLRGTPTQELKEELAGDMDFLFAGGCPADLEALNNDLFTILSKDYDEEDFDYNQDLLALFLEYKSITTKFLPNHDNN